MKRLLKYQFLFATIFLILVLNGFTWQSGTEEKKSSGSSPLKETISSLVDKKLAERLSDYLAIETGVIGDGEQIPLPKFKDGSAAKREQCKYFVSPSTINTVLFGWASSAGYYLVCKASSEGKVDCYLAQWQPDKEKLVKVEDPKNQYHTIFQANYLVIATRE